MSSSAATFKVVSAVVIWALALVGAAFPLVVRDRIPPRVTSMLNMLAGGIFLAGSCLHLLPDAEENRALAEMGCLASGKCLHLAHFFFALGFPGDSVARGVCHGDATSLWPRTRYHGCVPHGSGHRADAVICTKRSPSPSPSRTQWIQRSNRCELAAR
ncbi:hypothetical protein PINS_up015516 [Pythium insidiosum]|nr:hypothetical protein PINS_up015516 [Pythium insidiosum]